jgi:outer membrane protein OmpA-like peptidoglycan-associated protein
MKIYNLLCVAGAILMLSGCRSATPITPVGESHSVATLGVDQKIDPETGRPYYALCHDCNQPTPKTMMTAPAYRPITPVIVSEPKSVALPEPKPKPESANPATSVPVQETNPAPIPKSTAVTEPPTPSQLAAFKYLVPFATGRAQLGPQGQSAMASILVEAMAADRIHVRGYTDIIGAMPSNKRLAMARAKTIRDYLVKGGVAADKITTSYCIDCFADSNETEQGREVNRRAVVVMRPLHGSPDISNLYHRDACKGGAKISNALY